MSIQWTQPSRSGLCDRLIDVLLMCTYVRIHNQTLHMQWPAFKPSSLDTSHRQIDVLWENVSKFMVMPPDVVITDAPGTEQFAKGLGGAVSISDFYRTFLSSTCGYELYLSTLQSVASAFKFCHEINEFLETLPKKFVSIHIRRGDKVRPYCDHTFIKNSELEWLDTMTLHVINSLMKNGTNDVFICGDEDLKLKPFRERVLDNRGHVIRIPEMEKWQGTYYDLAVMSRSQLVVASQRHTSFSKFAALIGQGHFMTIFEMAQRP